MSVKNSLSRYEENNILLEHEIVNKIEHTLKCLVSLTENKILLLKQKSFLHLRSYEFNQVTCFDQISFRILRPCMSLIKYHRLTIEKIKLKFLHKWRCSVVLEKFKKNLRNKIQSTYENLNKKTNLEAKIKKLDEENLLLRTKLNTIGEGNIKANNTIKSYEEKEEKFLNIIRSLEKDNEKLSQELQKSNPKKTSLEDRQNKLKSEIERLQQENKEKENYLEIYIREMNDMLDNFEELSNRITKQQAISDTITPSSVNSPDNFKISSIPSKLIIKPKQKPYILTGKTHHSHQNSKSPVYSSHIYTSLIGNNKIK